MHRILTTIFVIALCPTALADRWGGQARTRPMDSAQQGIVATAMAQLEASFPNLVGTTLSWNDIVVENIEVSDLHGAASPDFAGLIGVDFEDLDGFDLESTVFFILFHEIQHAADLADNDLTLQDGCAFHCRHMEIYWQMFQMVCDGVNNPNVYTYVYVPLDACEWLCETIDLVWSGDTTSSESFDWLECVNAGECPPGTPNPFSGGGVPTYPAPDCCDC